MSICICRKCNEIRIKIFLNKLKIYAYSIKILQIKFEFVVKVITKILPRILSVEIKEFSNHIPTIILTFLASSIDFFIVGNFRIQTVLSCYIACWIGYLFVYTSVAFLASQFLTNYKPGVKIEEYSLSSVQKIALSFVEDSLLRYENPNYIYSKSIIWRLFKVNSYLFSSKTNKEVFEPIVADWQEEYFEALSKKEIWKARWINGRYSYAFVLAMWQKSPISDLIEFVIKIAKQ